MKFDKLLKRLTTMDLAIPNPKAVVKMENIAVENGDLVDAVAFATADAPHHAAAMDMMMEKDLYSEPEPPPPIYKGLEALLDTDTHRFPDIDMDPLTEPPKSDPDFDPDFMQELKSL